MTYWSLLFLLFSFIFSLLLSFFFSLLFFSLSKLFCVWTKLYILPNHVVVQSLSCLWLCDPINLHAACQVYGMSFTMALIMSFTVSWSLFKLMSIELVMPSNHLLFYLPLLLPPSVFPRISFFSSESAFHIRWSKYWSFNFSISPSSEYSELIDWMKLSGQVREEYKYSGNGI